MFVLIKKSNGCYLRTIADGQRRLKIWVTRDIAKACMFPSLESVKGALVALQPVYDFNKWEAHEVRPGYGTGV